MVNSTHCRGQDSSQCTSNLRPSCKFELSLAMGATRALDVPNTQPVLSLGGAKISQARTRALAGLRVAP